MKIDNTTFPANFKDFIIELNQHQVEYLIIGGYALGAYGHIRGTNDLDIFINATEENAGKMMKAALAFGVPQEAIQKEMFLVPKMIGIGDPPVRIEILKHLDIVDFKYAYTRANTITLDNLPVKVISLDDLILLKKAAIKGRTEARDKEDLTYLQKLKNAVKIRKKGRRL